MVRRDSFRSAAASKVGWVRPAGWSGALVAALVAGPSVLVGQATITADDCVACHVAMGIDRLTTPAQSYPAVDIHAERGFTCLDCHRRDESSSNPHAGFGGSPERREIPGLCGGCHSDAQFMRQFNPNIRVDQVAEYLTSGHGERLMEADDPDVATCVDCHPAHRIRRVTDSQSSVYVTNVVDTCGRCHASSAMMATRSIGTDQVAAYRASVHGRMLFEQGDRSAPVCNDCHGNHGAAPPGVSSVHNVCGQCHLVMADHFGNSKHQVIFDAMGMPECATCHGNHAIEAASDALLTTVSARVCLQCHRPDDERGRAFLNMAAIIDSLHEASARSLDALHEAENMGMEVSQALFELEDVNDAVHRARSAVHTFQVDLVRQETQAGLEVALRGLERGEEALRENRFRRVGLGLSSAVILLLIGALILKIRDMDARAGLGEGEAQPPATAGHGAGVETIEASGATGGSEI
jgi:predicted CXXCH cytochrome family protein